MRTESDHARQEMTKSVNFVLLMYILLMQAALLPLELISLNPQLI